MNDAIDGDAVVILHFVAYPCRDGGDGRVGRSSLNQPPLHRLADESVSGFVQSPIRVELAERNSSVQVLSKPGLGRVEGDDRPTQRRFRGEQHRPDCSREVEVIHRVSRIAVGQPAERAARAEDREQGRTGHVDRSYGVVRHVTIVVGDHLMCNLPRGQTLVDTLTDRPNPTRTRCRILAGDHHDIHSRL